MSIKVGDWVAFQVAQIDSCGDILATNLKGHGFLQEKDLTIIPAPDPYWELKEEVVDAANQWCRASDSCEQKIAVEDLCGAVDALEKAQRPPSKYAGLRKIIENARNSGVSNQKWCLMEAELAKLEAEERA